MAPMEMRDKDPFSSADAKPKDNISIFGFIFRAIVRYGKVTIFFYVIVAIVYSYLFGTSIFDFFGL